MTGKGAPLKQTFALNYKPAEEGVKRVAKAIGKKGSPGIEKQLAAVINKYARNLAIQASREVLKETRDRCPDATGDLRASLAVTPIVPSGKEFLFTLEAPLLYAGYSDAGTKPHKIWGKPWLVFVGDAGWVFLGPGYKGGKRGFVNHPGNKAQHWFGSARPSVQQERFHNALESGRLRSL